MTRSVPPHRTDPFHSFLLQTAGRPRVPPPQKKKFPAVGKPHMAQVYRHDAIMRLTVIVLAADRALAEA